MIRRLDTAVIMCARTQMTEQHGDWSTQRLADEAGRRGRPISREHVRRLCEGGKIPGARKPARDWLIPDSLARAWLDEWVQGER